MESELQWRGSSFQPFRFLKGSSNDRATSASDKPIAKVEKHIDKLSQSLSNTQAALIKASEVEQAAQKEHVSCTQTITDQESQISSLEAEIRKLYEEIELCNSKRERSIEEHERLEGRIEELMEQVKQAEENAEDNRAVMDNERLVHLQEREALRVVQDEHESCLTSLRDAQEALAECQKSMELDRERVARRDATIDALRRDRSRMVDKISSFTSALRRGSKELHETKKRLTQVSEQLREAEQIIQSHFTMLSTLETFKQKLAEELGSLRQSYEHRTSQLVKMREALEERSVVIADLREGIADRDEEIQASKLDLAFARKETAEAKVELSNSQREADSAERRANQVAEMYSQLENERRAEKEQLDCEIERAETALDAAREENMDLRTDLSAAQADACVKLSAARENFENTLDEIRHENGNLKSELVLAEVEIQTKDERHAQLEEERAHEKAEMEQAQRALEQDLDAVKQENTDLKTNLDAAEDDCRTKDQLLAQEIAAHYRTSAAAEKQRLRLQRSIDDLRGNLKKANDDLRKTREILFTLNEKCHNITRAQLSLSTYRNKTKMLLESEKQGKQLAQIHEELSDVSGYEDSLTGTPEQELCEATVTLMLKVRAQEQTIGGSSSSSSQSDPTKQYANKPAAIDNGPITPSASSPADSIFEPPMQRPKHVRFASLTSLASDEGYQTDESKAETSEDQIYNLVHDLDRARKGFKALKRRQRLRNLKSDA